MSRLAPRQLLLLLFPATVASLLTCLACTPQKSVPDPQEVYPVGPVALVRSYRDGHAGDIAYTGQRVSVRLPARGYEVARGHELHYSVRPDFPAAIVFVCHNPPKDNTAAVTVTGTCLGADRDGVARGIGVAFRVIVTDCTVTPG